MKVATLLSATAAGHAAFLVGAYGSGVLRPLPYNLAIFIWLGASTIAAFVVCYILLLKLTSISSPGLRGVSAAGICALSLSVGVFLALNLYGS